MDKNILQEYCQKRHLALPIYKTEKVSGQSHNPEFQSTVTLSDNKLNQISVSGKRQGSKKQAELSAAAEMIKYIKSQLNHTKYTCDHKVLIWIDMENIHLGDFFDEKEFSDNFVFVGFATENHPSVSMNDISIRTIKSSRSDACDVLMIAHTGEQLNNLSPDDEIIIVTRDHFGDALVEYICQNSSNKAINIKSISELNDYLNNMIKK